MPRRRNRGSGGFDVGALHSNTPGDFARLNPKKAPGGTDVLLIEDSAEGGMKKRIRLMDLFGADGNVPSVPPEGANRVTNIYVVNGKLQVEYEV